MNRFQGIESAILCSLAGQYDNQTQAGEIDSLESIPGLLKRLQSRALYCHRLHFRKCFSSGSAPIHLDGSNLSTPILDCMDPDPNQYFINLLGLFLVTAGFSLVSEIIICVKIVPSFIRIFFPYGIRSLINNTTKMKLLDINLTKTFATHSPFYGRILQRTISYKKINSEKNTTTCTLLFLGFQTKAQSTTC